jgi:SAM-dependent methyltransferase
MTAPGARRADPNDGQIVFGVRARLIRIQMIGRGVRRRLARAVASTLYALALAVPLSFAAPRQSEAELQRFHRVDDLLKLLDARPGALIAEVGAGEGFITIPIARAVTPGGRVVAEDIDEKALAKLRERADREHLENVEVVLGTADDPHLPAQLDAALIHNAYHEMTAHEAILAHIRESLRPGGRLLIVEPMHDSSRGLPREKQEANHDIEIRFVEDDLRAAGFEIQQRDVDFVKFKGVAGGFWLLLARRP